MIQEEINNEYKEKISFLKNYYWIIVNLIEEFSELNNEYSVKSSRFTGMPKSLAISTIDDMYIKFSKEQGKINEHIKKIYERKKKIENAVNKIEYPHLRYIIKSKYLKFQTFEEIAEKLDKSTKQISRWHYEGINSLELPQKD